MTGMSYVFVGKIVHLYKKITFSFCQKSFVAPETGMGKKEFLRYA